MEYKILYAQSLFSVKRALEELGHAVADAIALGWEPIGGVSITDHGLVAQAVVKRR